MKRYLLHAICFTSLQAHAEIIQHHAVLDDAYVSVRAGEQRNGTLAIDRTINKTTTSAQEALSSATVAFNDGSLFSGGRPRNAGISTFSLTSDNPQSNGDGISLPTIQNKPKNPIPPVTAAVPEPETFLLMALGLATLIFRKKLKIQ